MIKYFMAFCLALLPILAEKRIECVGTREGDRFTAMLKAHGINIRVVNAEWETLREEFKKDNSRFGKLKRKIVGQKPIALDQGIEKIVFMNIPPHLFRDNHMRKLPKEKLVLFMWEPLMHSRKMYNKNLHECIGRVYTWDDDLVDNVHYFKFYYPALIPKLSDIPSFEEKKFCTMISGCHLNQKFPTKYPTELYSERKKTAVFFDQVGETGFDLYGKGWDEKIYPSYRGFIVDKLAVMKNYRFAICYENCQHVKGYISEKIFDCFATGTVPIYWGASNITDYIPKDCFIDRRDFETLEQLYAFLKQIGKEEFDGYLERAAAYLTSDRAKLFSQENFERIFVEAVSL
jgi:hypothetical protein